MLRSAMRRPASAWFLAHCIQRRQRPSTTATFVLDCNACSSNPSLAPAMHAWTASAWSVEDMVAVHTGRLGTEAWPTSQKRQHQHGVSRTWLQCTQADLEPIMTYMPGCGASRGSTPTMCERRGGGDSQLPRCSEPDRQRVPRTGMRGLRPSPLCGL